MRMIPGFHAARQVLGPGPYRNYTIGNSISLIGTWMQRISVGYLTWDLTGSATWLGLVAFADLFPTILVGPLAGVLADRWSRHRLLLWMQALGALNASLLALLYAGGLLTIPVLVTIILAQGIVQAVAQPARLSMISRMVPPENLAAAVAISSISFNLARFLGPAAAGLLISTAGITWAFAVNAASFLAFILALLTMPPTVLGNTRTGTPHFFQDLRDGFVFIVRDRHSAAVLLSMTIVGLGSRPVVEMLPGFSDAVFSRGAAGLAFLTSSIGVGAMFGGAFLANRPAGARLSSIFLFASVASAACVMLFCAIPDFYSASAMMVCAGFFWVTSGISAQTMLQVELSDELRGRVMSIFGLVLKVAPAIGALGIGALSDFLGLRIAVAGAAGAVVLILLVMIALSRRLGARQDVSPGG